MKTLKYSLSFLALIIFSCGSQQAEESKPVREVQRIVSLKGVASEIISALGCEDELVGVDVTSVFPESLKSKENLGHVSGASAQSILSLKPSIVIADEAELNAETKSQLEMVGVRVYLITQSYTHEGSRELIKQVGQIVEKTAAADSIVNLLDAEMKAVTKALTKEKIVFIYARGAGTLMVAGGGTQMDALIKLSGHTNPFGHIDGFVPLTAEALVQANPDVLFFFTSGFESLGGTVGLTQIPGCDIVRAGKENRVIHIEGSLASSFGPRLPKAIQTLINAVEELNAR